MFLIFQIKYCKADKILCERLRFYDEKELFEQQKKAVLQGTALFLKAYLPPSQTSMKELFYDNS